MTIGKCFSRDVTIEPYSYPILMKNESISPVGSYDPTVRMYETLPTMPTTATIGNGVYTTSYNLPALSGGVQYTIQATTINYGVSLRNNVQSTIIYCPLSFTYTNNLTISNIYEIQSTTGTINNGVLSFSYKKPYIDGTHGGGYIILGIAF